MEEYTEYCLHYRKCGLRSPKRRFNLDRSRLPTGAPHEQGMLDPSQADTVMCAVFSAVNSHSSGRHLALAKASRGNYEEAIRYIELVESMRPEAGRFAQLSFAYSQMGRAEDAQRFFDDFERRALENRVSDAWWAQAYAGIGDFARALESLEAAVEHRELTDQAPLTALTTNQWRIPELDEPEFRVLLDNLWSDQ